MNNKYIDTVRLYIAANGVVQTMMTAGITIAAMHFNRLSVMWFYLIPALMMSANFTKIKDGDDK